VWPRRTDLNFFPNKLLLIINLYLTRINYFITFFELDQIEFKERPEEKTKHKTARDNIRHRRRNMASHKPDGATEKTAELWYAHKQWRNR
jgi:hypothetical protein